MSGESRFVVNETGREKRERGNGMHFMELGLLALAGSLYEGHVLSAGMENCLYRSISGGQAEDATAQVYITKLSVRHTRASLSIVHNMLALKATDTLRTRY